MTLAELVIKLSADTAVLRSDFEKGKAYAQSFAADVSKIFSAIGASLPGLSVAGIGKELEDLAESTAKVGEQLYKMRDVTGLSAEDLSGLRAIAGETGESFEGMSGVLAKFGKNIESGFVNPTGQAGKVLHELFSEQEINQMKLAPMSERLADVSKKIFSLTDAAKLDYDAAALFGKGWAENAEILKRFGEQGAKVAGFKAAIEGLAMTDEEITRTRQFAEGLDLLKLSFVGLGESIGKALIPAMGPMADFDDRLEELETHHVVLSKAFGNPGDTPQMEGAAASAGLPLADFGLHMYKPPTSDEEKKDAARQWREYSKSLDVWLKDDEKYIKALDEAQKLTREWGPVLNPVQAAWDEYSQRMGKVDDLMREGVDVTPLMGEALQRLGEGLNKANAGSGVSWGNLGMQRASEGQMNNPLLPMLQATPALKQVHDQFATLDADAYEFGKAASESFTKMVIAGRGFEQALRGLVDLFAQFLLKAVVFQNLSKVLGQGNSITGVIGSFFGGLAGGRAGGGDVNYGQSYLVGEQGPEIFTPTTSGMITPNDAMSSLSGGSRGGDTYIDARGADAGVEYRVQRALAAVQKKATVNGYMMSQEMAKRGA